MAAINLPRIIRIGAGALNELPEAMTQCGRKRPFVVTDGFLVQSGMAAQLLGVLEAAGMPVQVFAETMPDPTVAVVEQALEALRWSGSDCVIGFGGGSPIDTAKAIAALAFDPRQLATMKAPAITDTPGLPKIEMSHIGG